MPSRCVTVPPPPVYGPPPRPLAWQSPGAIGGVALLIFFVVGIVIVFAAGLSFGPAGFPAFVFAPFCAVFVIILLVVVVAASRGMMQPRIPPPPPIQQPMVPAGQTGPIALNCPNCGAPPQNVDRFGVATCTYCNTRFLVR